MYANRLERLRQEMKAQGLGWSALVPGFNLQYLTGEHFHFMERPLICFIPADENLQPVVVLPTLEVKKWERGVPHPSQLFPWEDETGPEQAMRLAADELGEVPALAVEHLRMRVLELSLLQRYMPGTRFVRAEDILSPLRMKKDAGEIALMRRAVEVTEAVLEDVVAAATPGLAERAICTRLMASLLSGGGESIPFEPLVQSGPNAAFPHGQTSDRRLERGDMLLIDLSTTVDGYHSDITRTFVVGAQPTTRLREIYAVVEAANEAGRAAVRPGATCEDVDRATRQVIVEAGYGKEFSHRTGHGLGLDVHEDPSVVEGNTLQLEPGMTLTIEPGIYVEGWGGVRIEDDVVVTDQGCESLSTFDRALQLVGV